VVEKLDQLTSPSSTLKVYDYARLGTDDDHPAYQILYPKYTSTPLVFSSPHSGNRYPESFLDKSKLDPLTLRRSEDSFVDELFAKAPLLGAPLLKANFPRAYVDPNREAFELDPTMFEDCLPEYVNTKSLKVWAGLGTVARVVTNGEEIYRNKLKFTEVKSRVENTYIPYHQALKRLIKITKEMFGLCILIDCHSMPSLGGPMDNDRGNRRVDIVLGNNHGTTCASQLISLVGNNLRDQGMMVRNNNPYSGGFTTCHYGAPNDGIHTLQIEINKSLYMDEKTIRKNQGFEPMLNRITRLISELSDFELL